MSSGNSGVSDSCRDSRGDNRGAFCSSRLLQALRRSMCESLLTARHGSSLRGTSSTIHFAADFGGRAAAARGRSRGPHGALTLSAQTAHLYEPQQLFRDLRSRASVLCELRRKIQEDYHARCALKILLGARCVRCTGDKSCALTWENA